jgi:hypothetical protein
MEQFLPAIGLAIVVTLFSIARFENQRWVRARANGLRGASNSVGIFVDTTAVVAGIVGLLFLAAYAYDGGWKKALGVVGVSFLASVLYSFVLAFVIRGDSLVLWIVGTVAVWPLMAILVTYATWFGFFA